MESNRRHPETVAYWEVDEETGEVIETSSYTNW